MTFEVQIRLKCSHLQPSANEIFLIFSSALEWLRMGGVAGRTSIRLPPPSISTDWLVGNEQRGRTDLRWGLLSHQGSTFVPWLKKMIPCRWEVVHPSELWGQKKSKRKIFLVESQVLILLSHVSDDLRGESIIGILKLNTLSRPWFWLL